MFLPRLPNVMDGLKRSKKRLRTGVHGLLVLAFEDLAIAS
jgi:hypothetical protein